MEDRNGIEPAGHEAAGAGPRIARELLRTPVFKDLIISGLNSDDAEDPRELVRALLWEDAGFTFGILGHLPKKINSLVAFLDELGIQLQILPPEMLREFISQLGNNLDREAFRSLPRSYAPLLNALLWEDPEKRAQLRRGVHETMSALMRLAADALRGGEEARLGADTAPEYPDPQALGELITALFRWLGEAAGKDPAVIRASSDKKIAFIHEVLDSADFGVIRQTLVHRAQANRPVKEALLGLLIGDPVRFANLFKLLSTAFNGLFNTLATAVSSLDYPSEILASAVFNLVEDLETAEIAALVNSLCRFIGKLHEGSLILGRDEPLFRPVLRNLMEGVLGEIDAEALAGALQALLEDSEVILTVTADVLLQTPGLLGKVFPALLLGLNALLRGAVHFINRLEQLPPETFRRLGRELKEKADLEEVGALLNALVAMLNRVLNENPDLLETTLSRLYRSLDKEGLRSLGGSLLSGGLDFARGEALFGLTPQTAGDATNALLTSYNLKVDQDRKILQETLNTYLGRLDYGQLDQAVANTAALLGEGLEANPQFTEFVMKWLFTIMRAVIKIALSPKNWGRLFRSAEKKNGKRRQSVDGRVGRAG